LLELLSNRVFELHFDLMVNELLEGDLTNYGTVLVMVYEFGDLGHRQMGAFTKLFDGFVFHVGQVVGLVVQDVGQVLVAHWVPLSGVSGFGERGGW